MVVNAGWQNTKSAVLELADVGLDKDVQTQVTDSTQKFLATLGQSITVKNVGGIKSGQNLLVEVQLQVQDGTTIGELHDVEKGVREVIGTGVSGVRKVRVRFVGEEVESEFVEEPVEEKKDL
jgi:divalent metal cation (Fe/Co/Zn/Cd) transporter